MSELGRHIGPSSIRTGASVLFLAGLAVVMMWPAVSQPDASLAGLDVHIHRSWEAVNRLAFDAGRLPHWNPYSFSGYAGLADIQTQVFYPPSVGAARIAAGRLHRLGRRPALVGARHGDVPFSAGCWVPAGWPDWRRRPA